MYTFTKGLCVVALVTSAWAMGATIPLSLFLVLLIGSQIVVYAMIARFAWLCRKNPIASGIVILMTLLAVGLGAVMLYFLFALISAPSSGGPVAIFIMFPVFGQMVVGILGCYVGYALVECRARNANQEDSTRGKRLVISITAVAVGFVAILCVFSG